MSRGLDVALTMRALRLVEAGRIEVATVPVPAIGVGEVLVKVAGAGLCHSDLHLLHVPAWPVLPMILGHETAGHVAAFGAEVDNLAEGDPVLVHLVWACGVCRPCTEGRDNVCATTGGRHGTPPCPGLGPDGGMADYIKVPARFLEPLGAIDPVAAAPLADAGMTSMHAIEGARHRLGPGTTAVVIGFGGLGHVAVQILLATTEARVAVVDTDAAKLGRAVALGATSGIPSGPDAADAILELTAGFGADVVLDFVGVDETVELATRTVASDGALRFVGMGGGAFTYASDGRTETLPWGVDVRCSYGGTRADLRRVVALANAGDVTLDITTYPLADGLRAFGDLADGRVPGRAVLVP